MIEFCEWNTPFSRNRIFIIDISSGLGPAEIWIKQRKYRFNRNRSADHPALVAGIFDSDQEIEYTVSFESFSGFRRLDEGGLVEIWTSTNYDSGALGNCFRVKNHSWTKESPVTFLATEGWSYMIITSDDCLEVVSTATPIIERRGRVGAE